MMLPSNSERGEDDDDCSEVKIIGAQMVHAAQRYHSKSHYYTVQVFSRGLAYQEKKL